MVVFPLSKHPSNSQFISHLSPSPTPTPTHNISRMTTPPSAPPPPPPPPLPQPNFNQIPIIPASASTSKPTPPHLNIPPTPPTPNARLVSLLIYNGWPFADHWEYFIASSPSNANPADIGTVITAAGNVRVGFNLEIKRGWDLGAEGNKPDGRVGLGWVGGQYFEGHDDGKGLPGCEFERAVFRCPAPGKTLRSVEGVGEEGRVS
jgi:hypothetical protein